MLLLTVLQGPDKGRRFELPDNEPQMIGRSGESLPLADHTISRRHAELTPDDGEWYIRDLASSNGTFVNGVRVTDRRLLHAGDQVRTGATLLIFGEEGVRSRRGDSGVRVVRKNEIDVNVQNTAESSDDSMIMAVPEPSQAAQTQLRVIYQLTSLIGAMHSKKELLEQVMDLIFEHFEADRGFVLLMEDPKDRPNPIVVRHRLLGEGNQADATPSRRPAAAASGDGRVADRDNRPNENRAAGHDGSSKRQSPIEVSRTIVSYVVRNGVGVLSSNAMTDTRFATGDSVQRYGIRSVLCVPIKFKDKIYGVLHIDSQIANYTYTEDQLLLLTAIGVQTGLALNNQQQYEARLRSERLAAVGQTVASLSHSIKNILQGLRGGQDVVDLGLRKGNMKVTRNGWEIVTRNMDRIYELTMNMLAYSKQRKPEFELTNLPQLLEEICALAQKQYGKKQVALLQDFDVEMPPVPMDSGGIHQAVLNLVNNALDAVEPESGVVSVRCAYDEAAERVRIAVADNGEGMSPATRNKLFEPFHSTKGLQGTGLGLVVTKKVVDEHGGTIDVESEPKHGTTFTLSLPIQAEAVGSPAETQGAGGAGHVKDRRASST